MLNKYGVGAVGRKIHIALPPPNGTLTARDAMEFAAWLVASACPMLPGSASDELGKFHKLIADAAEGTDLEGAALEALEDD